MTGQPPASASSISGQKRQIRQAIQGLLRQKDPPWMQQASETIVNRILGLDMYRQARSLLLFGGSPLEVNLDSLAAACVRDAKRVGVPRVDWATGTLTPVWTSDWANDLRTGRFGIREACDGLLEAPIEELDLVIVPGVAFDRIGGRLGRGAGFFDRFLASARLRATTCGVAFSFQTLATPLPVEAHDVPMQALVTESETVLTPETA